MKMSQAEQLSGTLGGACGELLRDGYIQFRNVMPQALVAQVLQEADAWFEADRVRRTAQNVTDEWFESGEGGLTRWDAARGRQVCLRAFEHAPSVLDVVEHILATPEINDVMVQFLGRDFVANDCMLRRHLSGQLETACLELHRDTPFDFGVGVFLEPIDEGCGATAVAPGSQYLPIPTQRLDVDPNLPIGEGGCVELKGRPGDCYIFLGETYHGVLTASAACASRILLLGFHPGPGFLPPDPLGRLRPPSASALADRTERLGAVFRREPRAADAPGPLYRFVVETRELALRADELLRPLSRI